MLPPVDVKWTNAFWFDLNKITFKATKERTAIPAVYTLI